MTDARPEPARRPAGAPHVLLTGMFDMRNFGDLMFPVVARHRLASYGLSVGALSPTGAETGLSDAVPSRPLAAAFDPEMPVAAVVIGGGYIVHTHRLDVLREYRCSGAGAWAGAAPWLGATLAAAVRDVPVAWNAPGAPHPLGEAARPLASAALRAADYVSVRDRASAAAIAAEGVAVAAVPDTVADIARMWPRRDLEAAFREFVGRLSIAEPERLLAVHVRRRSLGGAAPAAFARALDDFVAPRGLTPVLLGLGSSHGDGEFAQALARHLRSPAVVLDAPESLAEVAAALAFSRLYLGSSLHGYVAAVAYGVPAVVVARPAYGKFRGFAAHAGRDDDVAGDWDAALRLAAERDPAREAPPLPEALFAALDAHWDRIAGVVARGPQPRREARLAFAAASFAAGVRRHGADWAFGPFVDRASLETARRGDDVRHLEPF